MRWPIVHALQFGAAPLQVPSAWQVRMFGPSTRNNPVQLYVATPPTSLLVVMTVPFAGCASIAQPAGLQVRPSPVYPALHAHVNESAVSVQVALSSHELVAQVALTAPQAARFR